MKKLLNTYRRLGWPLCLANGKKGDGTDWGRTPIAYKRAAELVSAGKNVGLILGPKSGVIDLEADSPSAEAEVFELFGGDVPPTPTWRSRRGLHRLFRYDERFDCINKAKIEVDKVEVRLGANGKQAMSLLPPSIADGFTREWLPGLSPGDVEPARLPEAIISKITSGVKRPGASPLVKGEEKIREGQRNVFLTSLAGAMRRRGLSEAKIHAELLAINRRCCDPPLPEDEVRGIVKSVMNYPPGKGGSRSKAVSPTSKVEDRGTQSRNVRGGRASNCSLPAVSVESAKRTFMKWLLLPDPDLIEVVLSVPAGNHLPGDPLWIEIVAAPGDAKTEILRALDGHPDCLFLSDITRASLISGLQLEGQEASILAQFDRKVVVCKDFTTLLSQPRDQRNAILGQLRDAFDGQASKAFGTGEIKSFRAKFNMLVAVTPVIDYRAASVQALGERFLRFYPPGGESLGKVQRALLNANREPAMRRELAEVTRRVLAGATKKIPHASKAALKIVADLAHLTATSRTDVARNGYTREVLLFPSPEVGTRVAKQLLRLAQGVALLNRRDHLSEHELRIVAKVALGSIPPKRRTLLVALNEAYPEGFVPASALKEKVSLPTGTLNYTLQDLELLGILEEQPAMLKTKKGNIVPTTQWRLFPEWHSRIERAICLAYRGE